MEREAYNARICMANSQCFIILTYHETEYNKTDHWIIEELIRKCYRSELSHLISTFCILSHSFLC